MNTMGHAQVVRTFAYFVAVLAATFQLAGCAVSTVNYENPTLPEDVTNQLVLDEEFDAVWDKLIRVLSSEPFVINNVKVTNVNNNVNQDSGLITLDFSTDAPEQFVDCGTATRIYGDETTTFALAGDSSDTYKEAAGINVWRTHETRRTGLIGQINVHVAMVPDGTRVSVNVEYVWLLTCLQASDRIAGLLPGADLPTQMYSEFRKTFNTNTVSGPSADLDYTCGPTGALESMILDIVR